MEVLERRAVTLDLFGGKNLREPRGAARNLGLAVADGRTLSVGHLEVRLPDGGQSVLAVDVDRAEAELLRGVGGPSHPSAACSPD